MAYLKNVLYDQTFLPVFQRHSLRGTYPHVENMSKGIFHPHSKSVVIDSFRAIFHSQNLYLKTSAKNTFSSHIFMLPHMLNPWESIWCDISNVIILISPLIIYQLQSTYIYHPLFPNSPVLENSLGDAIKSFIYLFSSKFALLYLCV